LISKLVELYVHSFIKTVGLKKEQTNKEARSYMKYAGMAYEIIGILVVAALIGTQLDKWLYPGESYFTAALLVLFLIGYLVKLYFSLIK
jgi:F0F1-type ATP synthase assembly protein I